MNICQKCGIEYSPRSNEKPSAYKQRKFCSIKCRMVSLADYWRGRKAHNNYKQLRICRVCGKEQLVSPAFASRFYCSQECMSIDYQIRLRGINHWNWQGGITEKASRDSLYQGYKDWRKAVYQRDGFACRKCGSDESGSLIAHHIKPRYLYPELVLDVANGLTLCEDCHKEVHYGK